ncbi:LLM class flavin-dependent oxidoreductase [Nocardiopsis sp. MG754419]|uniref:LLM class flavin-dependent oxidoreductase n=1 Tax=Nocardiopsis sp. MG754419 TaxID=2259865 RepID=UPI001BADD77D|nr:LLM class flavin-dependent oxidoreductase [Nocardiopsis sp. MG754419]MBR8741842.1 5,10-methylene tetrahydromethanopterin reductase [Nocardiopsis sp. MG754419]
MTTIRDRGVSLILPTSAPSLEEPLTFAASVRKLGLRRLWLGQTLALDPHQIHVSLAAAGHGVHGGTSVTLTPLRSPLEAALQARGAAVLTGRPYVAGYGLGAPEFVAMSRGEPYASPLTAIREYLGAVRGLLDGERVSVDGRYLSMGPTALQKMEHPPVEVGAGVLRKAMAQVAGEVADSAITWMTPSNYLQETIVPALDQGAERAGRPERPRLVTVKHFAVAREGRDPYEIAYRGAGLHLSQPHYAAMLRSAGLAIDPADPVSGARALVNFDVFATGTPKEIAREIARYYEAGVDEIVLNPCGVLLSEGTDAALRDVEDVVGALAEHWGPSPLGKRRLHALVRRHCLAMKDMIVGLDEHEPDPLPLDFMDPFAGFQLAVHLEKELDVVLAEHMAYFKGGTSHDLTEHILSAHPGLG